MKQFTLNELLADHQTGHSEFQDDNFITIRAGGTTYGQYKQALRELYRRIRGLRELTCDREKLGVEIKRATSIVVSSKDPFDGQLAEIETRRKTMQLEEADRVIENTRREAIRFYQQACALKDELGDLTPKMRVQLEHELWMHKAREKIAIDFMTVGKMTTGTIEMVCSMPANLKAVLLAEVRTSTDKLIKWFINRNNDRHFDDLPEIPAEDIIKQLEINP
ncbi:hypothetical protein KKE60_04200 [Patescibacteria group bacterium]|nr:hypothetical protein [Patescibacteria group bacterium]